MDASFLHADFDEKRLVLRQHPFFRDLCADTSSQLFANLPLERFASLAYSKRGALPYIQPRGGFTLWEQQLELTIALSKAGADFIPLTIDSHTRQNDYDRAAILLQQSEETGQNLLNGYPLLAHGVVATSELYKDINKPVSLRHGTPDPRMLVEAALDSGITEIEGGGLCYCIPYSRAYPIDRALLNWQYVDRLCATLSTKDRPIHRESFGALTATMVPPFMVVAVEVLELLLAVEQGVLSFAMSFSQTGSMIQDLATAKALHHVAKIYLNKHGYMNIVPQLVYHQWMGAFPSQRVYADALIIQGAVTAMLCNADKVVIKTRTEALGIPDIQSNVDAIYMTKYAMQLGGELNFTSNELIEEVEAIQDAASCVIDAVMNIGSGPLWERVAHSVRRGFIDIPFAPHQENLNQLWTLRDSTRSIRVADAGYVPLPEKFVIRERKKLGSRSIDDSLDRMLADIFVMLGGS